MLKEWEMRGWLKECVNNIREVLEGEEGREGLVGWSERGASQKMSKHPRSESQHAR